MKANGKYLLKKNLILLYTCSNYCDVRHPMLVDSGESWKKYIQSVKSSVVANNLSFN